MLAVVIGLSVIILSSLVYYWRTTQQASTRSTTAEPYGDYHRSLNKSQKTDKGETEWLNMGYWENTTEFSVACEALALKVITAARCERGGHVLDVGHATGDSLLLHLIHPDVPTPASLWGVTTLKSQHERAVKRVLKVSQESTTVQLYLGDAVYHSLPTAQSTFSSPVQTIHHPLEPHLENQTAPIHPAFTSIIALDCAYHFRTREQFLRQSMDCLAPGGSIALADMCVGASPATLAVRTLRRVYCMLFSIPPKNLVSFAEYEQIMVQIGYSNVAIEDVTSSVFPGFVVFLKSRGGGWWVFGWMIMVWWKLCGARFIVARGERLRG
ncbi:hypothetical protein BDV93DRAFT_521876 [Ceratobasidium sp. AG-I]|nr:hypothetical protein BDV93DRAFT_521876 [Ceratobasidium sp. AG-I]